MVNEQFFSQWGGVLVLVGLVLNLFFFGYINWKNLKEDLKTFTILDISTITIIGSLFFLRLITVISYKQDFLQLGGRMILEFFNFADGQFAYTGLVLGLIVSTSLIFKSSNRLKSIRFLLDKMVLTISILSFIDLLIVAAIILSGFNIADKVIVVAFEIQSLLVLILSRAAKVRRNRGILSSIFIITAGLAAVGVNIYNSSISGVWDVGFESIVALVLIVYGIIELISALPKKVVDEQQEREFRADNNINSQMGHSGSPLKYSQSFAKTVDNAFSDLTMKERVVSRIKNLKRKVR